MIRQRRQGDQRLIEVLGQALAVAIDDAVLQAALDGFGALLLDRIGGFASGEQFHQPVQRIVAFAAAIEDQVFGDLLFFLGDQMQRPDLRHVDDRAAHAGAARVVEEHRVQHGARGRVQPEADVGQPEDDLDIGKFGADRGDALQRPLRQLAIVLVAGGDGEGQRIDQQVGLRQAVPVAGEIDQPAGDAQFVLDRLRHADFVDGQRDHRGAELLRQHQAIGGVLLAVLEVDRVDDRLAAVQLQRGLDHRGFGAVDHQGRIHRGGEAAHHLSHFGGFVAADEGGADVERVGAFADLLAAHGDAAVPVVHLLQFAPFLRAVGVAAFADREDGVLLAQRHGLIEAGDAGHPDRLAREPGRGGTSARAARLRSIASSAAMCSIVVPQQPPIRLTPSSATKRSSQEASSAAPSG